MLSPSERSQRAKQAWVKRRANGLAEPWNKGKKGYSVHTEESKAKLRKAGLGRKHSPESIAKISSSKRGHLVSEDTRGKISRTRKGTPAWNKGKTGLMKHTDEWKQMMREKMSGEKSPQWKGGITAERKATNYYVHARRLRLTTTGQNFTVAEWEELKASVDYYCLGCARQEPEIKLTVDHIIPLSKGGHNGISNIQPLCQSCNSKKHDKIINYIEFAQP